MAIPATIAITTASGTLHGSDFHVSIHVRSDVRKWGHLYWAVTRGVFGAAAMHGPELELGCEV
jgi:hypothetical protein